MKHRWRLTAIALMFISIGLIAGLMISSHLNLFNRGNAQNIVISRESIDLLSRINQAMSEVSEAVKPAVVGIASTKTIHLKGLPSPFLDDPFLREFFGGSAPRDYKESGLGSGVIVSKDGYILTNNHVVQDADEIKVQLPDKRLLTGKVIGTDPRTDLAVIRINADRLPMLKLGDSGKMKVGDSVIAVGSPFGLNQTVTSGIISAKSRANVGISDYEDFIQTDAAINPGNSGGALVNIRGELIGINTAIVSSTGGYQGVGFAISSSLARDVMDSLIKHGKVVRGWLGVSVRELTPEVVRSLGLKNDKGALVAYVVNGSPAAEAGFRQNDVITEFDGKVVEDATAMRNLVSKTRPGKEVTIKYYRKGVPVTVRVRILEATPEALKLGRQQRNP